MILLFCFGNLFVSLGFAIVTLLYPAVYLCFGASLFFCECMLVRDSLIGSLIRSVDRLSR